MFFPTCLYSSRDVGQPGEIAVNWPSVWSLIQWGAEEIKLDKICSGISSLRWEVDITEGPQGGDLVSCWGVPVRP